MILDKELLSLWRNRKISPINNPLWESPSFVVCQMDKERVCFNMSELLEHKIPLYFKKQKVADTGALASPSC
jgi:hypothetical protein